MKAAGAGRIAKGTSTSMPGTRTHTHVTSSRLQYRYRYSTTTGTLARTGAAVGSSFHSYFPGKIGDYISRKHHDYMD